MVNSRSRLVSRHRVSTQARVFHRHVSVVLLINTGVTVPRVTLESIVSSKKTIVSNWELNAKMEAHACQTSLHL